MKKRYIPILSCILTSLACQSQAGWTDNTKARMIEIKDKIAAQANSFIEHDNENYWLNNIRTFKSYPINFYNGAGKRYDDKDDVEEIATREYPHNVVVSANLGQTMLDSETYTITTHNKSPRYQPTTDITLYNVASELKLKSDEILEPIGETKIEGIYYLLFDPKKDGRIILIDNTGRILHMICRIYRSELVLSKELTTVSPKDARVDEAESIKQEIEEPKFNFEIKYDGLEDGKMTFLYISSQNGGEIQRFTYPETQTVIEIYGNTLQIIKPYEDRVEYMILD